MSKSKTMKLVLNELQVFNFDSDDYRDLYSFERIPTHVTPDIIFKLMNKTKTILSYYNIENKTYSEKDHNKCVITLLESLNTEPISDEEPIRGMAYSIYMCGSINSFNFMRGNTISNPERDYKKEWKRMFKTESISLQFVISCVLSYRTEIDIINLIDCDTAEHLLAIYNSLFYHLNTYPPSSADDFHLLVKNICLIVNMNCIQYLNFYPQHYKSITNYY